MLFQLEEGENEMYPVKVGLPSAISRIKKLKLEGYSAEALVTSVFWS
jgi:hypothetical protein